MQKKQSASSGYQFSNVKVFPDLNVIEVQGESHRVEPKVMSLLNYLSQRQGEVCSKQDLIEAVWPNQIIADEALTRLVFVLRNVLGDDAKAPKYISTVPKKGYVLLEPINLPSKKNPNSLLLTIVLLAVAALSSIWFVLDQPKTEYKIVKSIPITFQEGREYGFVEGALLSGYFHRFEETTKLMVSKNGQPYKQLANDKWQKRSLQIVNDVLFYVRFNDNESQIIRQTLSSKPETLLSSPHAIYHLSLNNEHKEILFTQYKDNANTELHRYSFVDGQINLVDISAPILPKVIKQHFYDERAQQLVFVGIQSRLPVIYGYRFGNSNFRFEYSGFDNINSITNGRYDDTFLVAGSYEQVRGIWSVNIVSNEVLLLLNANDDVITDVHMSIDNQSIFYTSESYRQDIISIDWQGQETVLPKLNSTLIEGRAQYSATNTDIYFASDRTGSTELYQYSVNSQKVEQLTRIQANTIWHYSFSHHFDKLAIVYSTETIQLAIVDVKAGQLIRAIELEEIKFPLAWSKDGKSIYVSEHRSQIAMYLYDAETLAVEQKQQHLGLSAVEVENNEIIAFDYTRDQFVHYSFNDKTAKPISAVLSNSVQLGPSRVYVDSTQAYIVETQNDEQKLLRVQLSTLSENWRVTQESSLNLKASIQAITPQHRKLLFIKNYNSQNGSVIKLKLQP